MLTLLLYDIHAPALRVQVIAACEDRGLTRMQWSAFWGVMPRSHRHALIDALDGVARGQRWLIVHAVPLTREALRKMWVLEQGDVGQEAPQQVR